MPGPYNGREGGIDHPLPLSRAVTAVNDRPSFAWYGRML